MVIEIPHCDPVADGTSITRSLFASATYRFPPARLSPAGEYNSALPAGVPLPLVPDAPVLLPTTV